MKSDEESVESTGLLNETVLHENEEATKLKNNFWTGIGLAWIAVLCCAPEGILMRASQVAHRKGSRHDFIHHGTYVFWVCLGKGIVQLALTNATSTEGGSYIPASNTGWLCAFLGVLGGVGAVGFYGYGNLLTTAVMSYTFYYSYSLWTALFAVLVQDTPVPVSTWIAMSLVTASLVGMFLDSVYGYDPTTANIKKHDGIHGPNVTGNILCLVAAVCLALYLNATVYVSKHKELSHLPMTLYFGFGSILGALFIGIPLIISEGTSVFHGMDDMTSLWISLLCCVGSSYYFLLSVAVKYIGSTHTAIISTSDMILGPIISNFLFHEVVSVTAIFCQSVVLMTVIIHEFEMAKLAKVQCLECVPVRANDDAQTLGEPPSARA